ncbi:flavin monoamine oxidase family protein [Paenarthrobacter sp. NPDC058040]|uniref:flavin monoamine oxidase family protein n=1 Tax=unclassified Paenarthrobacter TaxID=2634190 RepID=UPI0036D9A834
MPTWDAIVVGGGFAGVMAARELSEAGLEVLLLEARDRLGGRTACRSFADTDTQIELGGTYFDHAQTHLVRETARYGLDMVYPPEPQRYIWYLNGKRFESTGLPLPWEEAVSAEEALARLRAEAARVQLETPHFLQEISDLDVSVSDFIKSLGVGPVTHDLLESWASLYSGTDNTDNSILYHLHSVTALGGSPLALAPALIIESGTASLIDAIASDFKGEVRLSTPVLGISQDPEGVTVTTIDGDQLRSKRAVVALPVNTLSDVSFDPPLNSGKQALFGEGHAGHGYKFFALVEGVQENIQAVGWGLNSGVTYLATAAKIDGNSLLVGFAHPAEGFSPLDLDDVQRAVEDYLPGARVLAVDGYDWNTDDYSQGTWISPRPGQLTGLNTSPSSDEGRLYFAGADLALRWFSWVEGALETGYEAAHRLIEASIVPAVKETV